MSEEERRMKIIWTFTLMMIPGVVSIINVTGYSGDQLNIICAYDDTYTINAKYFCRGQWSECKDQIRTETKDQWVYSGRFSLYDDTRAAVFTVNIKDLTEEDSGTYYCGIDQFLIFDSNTEVNLKIKTGSSLIIPLVLLLLFLIIAGLLALFLFRKCRTLGDLSSQNGPGKAQSQVSHTACDYEEIKDTQLPTNPSDSPKAVYSTAQLPTNPSDSLKTVYSNAQLSTNPSDSSVSIYSLAQKGTADSHYLNHAVVTFQKKADCPASVLVRNSSSMTEVSSP